MTKQMDRATFCSFVVTQLSAVFQSSNVGLTFEQRIPIVEHYFAIK